MRFFRKQVFILTTIFTLLASYVLPYINHASAAENYITVAQAIANNSGTATVKGYIVGYAKSGTSYITSGFPDDNNFGIADSPTETDPAKILPVQITAAYRAEFGLKTNPSNLGKTVFVTGTLTLYFSVPGLKTPTAMSFTEGGGGPVDPPVDPPADGIKISAIQGESHDSPYKGQTVNGVEGVVTFVKDASNFYIQDPTPDNNAKTSEGILVYQKNHTVKVGDLVSVDALVKEWVLEGYSDMLQTDLATTELDANAGKVTVKASGQELPKALVVGKDIHPPTQIVDNDKFAAFDPEEDGIDFYESIEGMRVAVENPVAVAPQRYGEVPVIAEKVDGKVYTTPGGIPITKDNMNPERLPLLFTEKDETYKVKTGDKYDGTVTGVITYTFQNYKLLTNKADLPALVESNYTQEVTDLVKDDEKLTVASYNMENYTKADTAKTAKIADSIVKNLKTPDIVGLVEVQDNNGETAGGTAADQNYQALIEAIKAKGGPTYKWTDIEPVNNQDGGAPNGNIRVGFIYNPDRVSLKTGAAKGASTQAVGYENGSLTLNPGRIDPTNTAFSSSRKPLAAEFIFKGEDVIVIANHFNSKGGDQPIFGKNQPPVLGSEAKRVEIAGIVNNFIKDVKSKNEDANVVVLGDLNDFEFSNPLTKLKGNELTNLIEKVPAPERFTYSYQGNSQVLDHMLVSNNLADRSEIDIVHLNSPFTPAHGRVSDHDAVLAQINLKSVATPPEHKAIDLSIMHVNDTHANVEQYPKLTTAVNEVRGQKPNALLVDAGDVFSGTLYFNQYLGKADLWFMNNLKYDAMTFGNHEFDKDSVTLAGFMGEMTFPMVSANVNVTKDPVLGPLFKNEISATPEGGKIYPAIVKTINGEKVGIFGLTTEDTTFLANPSKQIVFENAVEKAKTTVAALKEQGINKIVVLSHLGYGPDQELAKVVDGIDVIVGGHSHTKLDQPVVIEKAEPTVIVQANEYLKYLGTLDVTFDENGVVTKESGKLLDVNTYAPDAVTQAKVDELKKPLEELKKQVVGSSSVLLDGERNNVRYKETNLGNLIADGMAQKANEILKNNTTIAMQNGGGIRASIQKGDVTLGDIYTVLPFANLLVTLDLTGEEIWQALEHSVSKVESGAGQFMQVSGLQFKYDPKKDPYKRVWEVKVKTADGYEPFDLTKTYSVATNAFAADGGDGFTMFKKAKDAGRIHELLLVDYEILTESFAKNSPVSPTVEGRILTGEEPQVQNGWVQENGQWYYYENGQKHIGWLELEGKKYYFSQDGAMITGWILVAGNWYNLGADGVMQTGLVTIDGKKYYLGTDGVMKSGWVTIEGIKYFFNNNNGAMQTGWIWDAGKWYYLGTDGAMKTGLVELSGTKYYLGTDGVMQTGIITIEGITYYFNLSGAMETGFVEIEGNVYFFDETDGMITGFAEIDGDVYFFDEDGVMVTGWVTIDTDLYYFDEDGICPIGWIHLNNKWYFQDYNEGIATGWIKDQGKWYFMNTTGVMQTGWVKNQGKWYFLDSSGAMKIGWVKDQGKWYFLDASGAMKTGWVKVNGQWYLMASDGSMKTGWVLDQKKWYFLDASGAMKTGWAQVNGSWYFMNTSGAMQTGWLFVGGKWYYLYTTGKMAANTKIQGYKLGADGAWRK
ncbi:5'-nucleotidase C-terminal domain-containing protein [Bacillus salipaludis]|uniref:5'-nucleotidase C-terminal domain-containing protein n=1 Tax=Bacillus salipaludis TaxID=2547811 RepID=A0ABW8R9W9_9BACI